MGDFDARKLDLLLSRGAARLSPFESQRVPHLLFFDQQVVEGMTIRRGFAGDLSDDLDTGVTQGARLVRIVREKADSSDAKFAQDCYGQAEVSVISLEPERMVCFARGETLVLKRVSLQLRHQPDAPPLLMFIDHKAATFFRSGAHRNLQLFSTVAAKRPEHLACEALRMDAEQRGTLRLIAEDYRECGLDPAASVRGLPLEAYRLEHSPTGRHSGGSNSPQRPCSCGSPHNSPRPSLSLQCPVLSGAENYLGQLRPTVNRESV